MDVQNMQSTGSRPALSLIGGTADPHSNLAPRSDIGGTQSEPSPVVRSQAQEKSFGCDTGIPTILIDRQFIFIEGERWLWEDIPFHLGHDPGDVIDKTLAYDATNTTPAATTVTESVELNPKNGDGIGLRFPSTKTTCTRCKETFVNRKSLEAHLKGVHKCYTYYECSKCGKTKARYNQAAIHYSRCKREIPSEIPRLDSVNETVDLVEISDTGGPSDSERNETVDISDTSETSDSLSRVKCTECDASFKNLRSLGQHERHRHPNLRNQKRIASMKADIERKRAKRIEEKVARAVAASTTQRLKTNKWTDEEVDLLKELSVKFQGEAQINKKIAEVLTTKTHKQISFKRSDMTRTSQKHTNPAKTKRRMTTTAEAQEIDNTELLEKFKQSVLRREGHEAVEMSAKLLEGTLHAELITLIQEQCSKPARKGKEPAKTDSPTKATQSRRKSKPNEYRRIQQLYEKKRKQLAAEILDQKAEAAKCDIAPEKVHSTYMERFGGESQEVDLSAYPTPKQANNISLLSPISAKEVRNALARAKKDSSTGPDGIATRELKQLDPTGNMVSNLFNVWLVQRAVPERIKENRSILLPKGTTGLDDINNWRPLTISSVLLRLYTNILAKRVTGAVPLNPRQRGFIPAPGCSENGFLLQRVMIQAKKSRKRLSVVLLDLAKAFDTVSHKHLVAGLKRFGVNDKFIEVVLDLYTNASTIFTVNGGETDPIPMTRGVKQGDPLSPLLFNIAMDPLLEAISREENGYHWEDGSELQLEALCYADDNALLTESPYQMQKNLSVSAWNGVHKQDLLSKLALWCERIGASLLKPRQKLVMLQTYAIARLAYYLSQVDYPEATLLELDRTVRRHVKEWLHLPPGTTDHVFYADRAHGGLGLTRF